MPRTIGSPTYAAKIQYAMEHNTSPELCPKEKTTIQKIVGCLLYYALAINATILVALGDIASKQAKTTAVTKRAIVWLLNYAASHLNAIIHYTQSDMKLWAHGDASYISVIGAKIRAGAVFFLVKSDPLLQNPLSSVPI